MKPGAFYWGRKRHRSQTNLVTCFSWSLLSLRAVALPMQHLKSAIPKLEILICTHNRRELLERTIASINRCAPIAGAGVHIFVAANACSDDTHAFLDGYCAHQEQNGHIALQWMEVATPGKSHALNHAIPLITSPLVAFVDDDHRVDRRYLVSIIEADRTYPEATIFCGRILPDWDGWEPAWAHEEGSFAIYPLPVPRYDQGSEPRPVGMEGPLPGGGNIFMCRDVFDRVGTFSTELGPHGHDLGGGEDSDYMHRALYQGEQLQYVPAMVQYHFVETDRFNLRYMILKSFQRSRSVTRVRHADGRRLPMYLWRKLGTYAWQLATSLYWSATRFYLVRIAATMGEISAYLSAKKAK